MSASPYPLLAWATLAVRLLGLFFLLLGGWQLVANLIDGWIEFDPTYLGYFLRSQMMRPGLAALVGLGLILGSRRLGRWLTRGLP